MVIEFVTWLLILAKSHLYFMFSSIFLEFFIFSENYIIILKHLFTSGSVNIAEYLPRLRFGKYSAILTSPPVNNC